MKRISPATVTLGVLAVLVGLAAAFAVRQYLESRPRPQGVAVVVPTINLPPYARVRDQDVEIKYLPPGQVPAGALTNSSQALFRLVKSTAMAGQPLLDEQLYPVGKNPTLAEQVPAGKRAVTIAVAASNALDGILLPESLVDISLTVQGDHPELAGVATLTLLRRVQVLATSRDRYRTEERIGNPLRSVTVAVTPAEANKLILAQRYGVLSVTLRSEAEGDASDLAADDDLVNPLDLLGLGPVRKTQSEIWRGTGVQQVNFQDRQIREAAAATAEHETSPEFPLPAQVGDDAPVDAESPRVSLGPAASDADNG